MAFWVTHGGLCKSARPGSRTRHNWIIEPLESRVLLATTPLLRPVLTSLAGNAPVLATAVGDVNGDGIVDFTDLLVLARNFGASGQDWSHGALNYAGTVTFADLLALTRNFGRAATGSLVTHKGI